MSTYQILLNDLMYHQQANPLCKLQDQDCSFHCVLGVPRVNARTSMNISV